MSELIHQLIVRRGPKQGHVYELHLPIVNVGRDPMSDINLSDPEISRQHARLIRTGDGYQLQDLNSTNGTYLNGKKIENEAVNLQPGQEVMMGSGVVLLYQVMAEEPDPPVPDPLPVLPEEDEEALEADRPATITSDFKFPQATASPPPAPAKTPPLPNLRQSDPPKPPPPASPQVVMSEAANGRRNQTLAIAIILILLCSCCAFLVFMYQWGGDWILQQLGMLP